MRLTRTVGLAFVLDDIDVFGDAQFRLTVRFFAVTFFAAGRERFVTAFLAGFVCVDLRTARFAAGFAVVRFLVFAAVFAIKN
jgi:hypothetical protein